ncbi:MAG TPA: 16S rRNA (cytosine(967)-C(5))-methyltransferase RsmB [Rubrivivax sp.]|nr:16S rRNA (cytosine(967)-C(5))-methyltransferase RsmB [Rubrivivax sp.]
MSDTPATPPLSRLLERSAAAVQAVCAGRSLNDVLAEVPAALRPGVQALTFQTLRQLGGADEVLRLLAPKPPAPPLRSLLCVALALLWPQPQPPYPAHTLVDQAVAAARRRAPGAAAFVNAVLRRFVREREALVAHALASPVAYWNHPAWWIEQLQRDWPAQWQALLAAANRHPPMTLRVNRRRGSGAEYQRRLAVAGQASRLLADPAFGGQALVLARPCPVERLPGFADGEVSVQDASAQRAARLLAGDGALAPGARVLDACAAPGGKTAHLLELADLELLALDADAQRLQRVAQTLHRLRLRAELEAADAAQPSTWWDGRPFDAILLDAPCSASGIVRRHPDIRWLRRPSDLPALAALQARLLDALWPLLKPGGRLLYATCSVFKCEGQGQIDAFLQRHGPASAVLHPASPGHLLGVPDNRADAAEAPHDGFYLALILKT